MNKTMIHGGIAAVALLTCVAATSALADTVKYKADLSGTSEVPPTTSAGKGTLDATYDTASKQLSYTVNYSGLTGPATAAHFHGPAAPGANSGVAVPVQGALVSPIKGTATLTDAQATDLQDGKFYFNIHTDANKPGEIRGQVVK
jgi:CHRD domain-containing protein